jgi:hypothetical protein
VKLFGLLVDTIDRRKKAALLRLPLVAVLLLFAGGCAINTGIGESVEENPVSLLSVPFLQEDCGMAYEAALQEGDDYCDWGRALNLWKSRCTGEFHEDDCTALAVKIENWMTNEYDKWETENSEQAQELGPVKVCMGICALFRVRFGNGVMDMNDGEE